MCQKCFFHGNVKLIELRVLYFFNILIATMSLKYFFVKNGFPAYHIQSRCESRMIEAPCQGWLGARRQKQACGAGATAHARDGRAKPSGPKRAASTRRSQGGAEWPHRHMVWCAHAAPGKAQQGGDLEATSSKTGDKRTGGGKARALALPASAAFTALTFWRP